MKNTDKFIETYSKGDMILTENQAINAIVDKFPELKADYFGSSIKLNAVLRRFEKGIRTSQLVLDRSNMCDDCKANQD